MTKSVFISSTSLDLQEHRQAVREAISRLGLHTIDMKDFGSQSGDAVEVSVDEVGKADIFVGILAHRYGYVPAGASKSVTEQEFDEVTRLGIPRLMYLVDPAYQGWPTQYVDQDALPVQRLNDFKARVSTDLVRSLFTTPANLAQQVSTDIAKENQRLLRADRRQRRLLAIGMLLITTLLAVLVFLFASAPDQEDAAIKGADRQATNAAQGLIDQTATASQWTPTPSATPRPAEPGEFSVVVAGFGLRGEDGTITQGALADNMSDVVYDAVLSLPVVKYAKGWRDVGVTHILADDPVQREMEAAAIAQTLQVDVVIYGIVEQRGVQALFEPEFYVAADYAGLEPELVGADQFGQPINYLPESDIQTPASTELKRRLELLQGFLQGLALYYQGEFEDSLTLFQQTTTNIERGLEVLYVFAGNAAIRADNLDAALAAYNQALEARPNYARALIGRGIVLYKLALESAGGEPPPFDSSLALDRKLNCADTADPIPEEPQLIADLALRCYREASLSQDKPVTADTDVKIAFGYGQVYTWMGLNSYGENSWVEAEKYLNEVLMLYETSDPARQTRIRAATAHANAWLGLRLLAIDGNDVNAVIDALHFYQNAVELLTDDVNLAYNQRWIDLYNDQIAALEEWLRDRITPTP